MQPLGDDVQEQLEALGDVVVSDPDDPNFRDLVAAAGNELKRRFDVEPESLPGTFVIKLFLDGQKAIAARAMPDGKPDARLSILDRIDALPPDHAKGLVQAEIERTERLVADLYEALKRLGA